MKIAVWGVGFLFETIVKHLHNHTNNEIVLLIDNDVKKHNRVIDGLKVTSPIVLKENTNYDYLLITSDKYFNDIRTQAEEDYGISRNKIIRGTFFMAQDIYEHYHNLPSLNEDQIEVVKWIKKNKYVRTFNYNYVEEYQNIEFEVQYDIESQLFYVNHHGQNLYFNCRYDTVEKVKLYYRSLLVEQDFRSPHKYLCDYYNVDSGDIVVDAGAAEGIFALDVVEKAAKVILIEADQSWNQALKKTFANYIDKVEIINKYLSEKNDSSNISLDEILKENKRIDLLKMDIEGFEVSALMGADRTLSQEKIKIAACTYHNEYDYELIEGIFKQKGIDIKHSNGYMVYAKKNEYFRKMVRGIIYGRKDAQEYI